MDSVNSGLILNAKTRKMSFLYFEKTVLEATFDLCWWRPELDLFLEAHCLCFFNIVAFSFVYRRVYVWLKYFQH